MQSLSRSQFNSVIVAPIHLTTADPMIHLFTIIHHIDEVGDTHNVTLQTSIHSNNPSLPEVKLPSNPNITQLIHTLSLIK